MDDCACCRNHFGFGLVQRTLRSGKEYAIYRKTKGFVATHWREIDSLVESRSSKDSEPEQLGNIIKLAIKEIMDRENGKTGEKESTDIFNE